MRGLRASPVPALLGAVLFLALLSGPAQAGLGKIAGRMTDAETGDPLPGANVSTMVSGIVVGAVADDEGRFFILHVPPGRYSVKGSMIGYRTL